MRYDVMLIAATDRKTSMLPFDEQVKLIAEAGPDMIILTERDMSPKEYKELAAYCMLECSKNGVEFCVDKFIDVAKELGVRSIHVDINDLGSLPNGFDRVVTTVRNEKEAINAESKGATMLIFRDVFDLSCKSCRNAKGLATLRYMLGAVDIPVIGAGGIYPDVFQEVLGSETAGICMRDAFMRTKDPLTIVERYRHDKEYIDSLM